MNRLEVLIFLIASRKNQIENKFNLILNQKMHVYTIINFILLKNKTLKVNLLSIVISK